MKRTAEMILNVVGIIINIILIGVGAVIASMMNDQKTRQEFENLMAEDPQVAASGINVGEMVNLMEAIGWGFVAIVILSTVLSVIAAFALRRNRKPKLAGGLLIASALIVGLGTFLIGWLPALLFLIAGILCFVRRERKAY
ncbi:DUF4064 domain-containing protein [Bacillus xiapuensis]|uniref:DUF4064 domain-containing protein n=1 Tax=Bacillus xiapuensis TaxID=2014075 RepID=UPI000C24E7D3|nr:DUF4064 domain-containing protein [Bacillus xiapuensis]